MKRGDIAYACADNSDLRELLSELNESTVIAVAGSNVTLLVESNGKFSRIDVPTRFVCMNEIGMHIGQPCFYCGFPNEMRLG